jgi:hypothetical protein
MEKWKKCCIKEIKRIWDELGGPINVVRYVGECPKCNHFIGLTQTSQEEANKLLKENDITRRNKNK